MEFTSEERKLVYNLLSKVLRADGKTNLNEAEWLYEVSFQLQITASEISQALLMTGEDAANHLKNLCVPKRALLKEWLMKMAKVDGFADSTELELINQWFKEEL
jgi:uncharacterized tellurite resistance protein B-like protein